MTKKQYTTVAEMTNDLLPNADYKAAFAEQTARRKIIKQFLLSRGMRGLSQKDVAQKVGCTQGRISKMENSLDDDLRIGDLRRYAEAIEHDFVALIHPKSMTPVEQVKCHVFAIKRHMDNLAELAKTDEDVAKGVAGFFYELFMNFARLIGDSAKGLPLGPDQVPYFNLQLEQASETPCGCEAEMTGDCLAASLS